jgi:hypothetical protein
MKLTFVLVILLLMLGCTLIPGGKDLLIDPAKFLEGRLGLTLSAADKAPPAKVQELHEFHFFAVLRNQGVADIENGILKLVILDNDHIEGQSQLTHSDISLKGKSLEWPEGETDMRHFSLKAKEVKNQMTSAQAELMLIACYDYFTELITDVCIDPDIYGLNLGNEQKACRYNVNPVGNKGQGGPVEFVQIESDFKLTDTGGVFPRFRFRLKNSGTGGVYKQGEHSKVCSSEPIVAGDELSNMVMIEAWLANTPMECEIPSGKPLLDISQQDSYAICTAQQEVAETSIAYTSTLRVRAHYAYTSSFSKPVMVVTS